MFISEEHEYGYEFETQWEEQESPLLGRQLKHSYEYGECKNGKRFSKIEHLVVFKRER